jgi:hypothetical protein
MEVVEHNWVGSSDSRRYFDSQFDNFVAAMLAVHKQGEKALPIKPGVHTGLQNLSMAERHRLWKRAMRSVFTGFPCGTAFMPTLWSSVLTRVLRP